MRSRWVIYPCLFIVVGGFVGAASAIGYAWATYQLSPPDYPGQDKSVTLRGLGLAALIVLIGPIYGWPAALATSLGAAFAQPRVRPVLAYVLLCGGAGALAGAAEGLALGVGSATAIFGFAGGCAGVFCGWLTRPKPARR